MGRPRGEIANPEVQAKILAIIRAGDSLEDAAKALNLCRRTVQRHGRRDPAFGAKLDAAVEETKRARQRRKAALEQLEAAATVKALSPDEEVTVTVVVPEVLQTPRSRVFEGDRPMPKAVDIPTEEEVYEVLAGALRDPEAPAHLIAVQAFTALHLGPRIEAAKIEAKAVAKENAARRRARRAGPNMSEARGKISAVFERRGSRRDDGTEETGQ